MKWISPCIFVALLATGCSSVLPFFQPRATPTYAPAPALAAPTATVNPALLPTLDPQTFLADPVLAPLAVAVKPTDTTRVSVYSSAGSLVQTWLTPGLVVPTADRTLAMHSSADSLNLTLLYFSFDNGGELARNDGSGSPVILGPAANLQKMAIAPGYNQIAYSTYVSSANYVESELFIGDLAGLPPAAPVLTLRDKDGFAFAPLQVATHEGQAQGVWLTWRAVNAPEAQTSLGQGLLFYAINANQQAEILPIARHLAGFSAIDGYYASTAADEPTPTALRIERVSLNTPVEIPLNAPLSGPAVFAPGGLDLAWAEGATLRLATTGGELKGEFPAEKFAEAAGLETVEKVVPVLWLDEHTLLLNVYAPENGPVVVRADARDLENGLSRFADGEAFHAIY